jgi:fatty acid amide hydrolase 2
VESLVINQAAKLFQTLDTILVFSFFFKELEHFNEQDVFSTSGPISRRASDLWPVLSILAGKKLSPEPDSVDISKLRVMSVERIDRLFLRNVSSELLKTQTNVVNHLVDLGCKYDANKPGDMDYALEIWSCMMHIADSPSYHELIGKPLVFWEIIKWIFNLSYHTFPGLTACYIEMVPLLSKSMTKYFCEKGINLKKELNDLLSDNGVLIFPSHPVSAPKHNSAKFVPLRW